MANTGKRMIQAKYIYAIFFLLFNNNNVAKTIEFSIATIFIH